MSPIETIARPRGDKITVAVPKEYGSCSFQVILVPLAPAEMKVRTIERIPGLSFRIKDEDLFSDDANEWESCGSDVPFA